MKSLHPLQLISFSDVIAGRWGEIVDGGRGGREIRGRVETPNKDSRAPTVTPLVWIRDNLHYGFLLVSEPVAF